MLQTIHDFFSEKVIESHENGRFVSGSSLEMAQEWIGSGQSAGKLAPRITWSGQAATKTLNWNHERTRMNTNGESTEYTE